MDVLDLWPDAIAGSGMVSSQVVIKGSAMLSDFACRIADRITVPTEGFAARLGNTGDIKNKLSVIPNWADKRIYSPAPRNQDFGNKFGLEKKFCIIHAGNIGPFQDIANVLSAAEQLRGLGSLRIVFVGGGRDIEAMKRIKEEKNLENVVFTGPYPTAEMSGIFAWGEGLLVSLRADPYLDINLPSKLPAYMASGKPVIACAGGESSKLVAENNIGVSCKPGDPVALADTIRGFFALSQEERNIMGRNGLLLFDKSYDKDRLIYKYVKMLEGLCKARE